MRNIKLVIEYDGTNYHGWQSQNNAVTVQDTVKKAIRELTGAECNLTGASRTDFGVHALGQVANFTTESSVPPSKFCYALNNLLPLDVAIRHSEEVSMDFHARFSSKGKKYRYLIYNASQRSALMRTRAFYVPYRLNFETMEKAAQAFLGRHDFTAFRASGSDTKTSERTITGVSLVRNGDLIEFEIAGDGFLYNMVRIIVGTLVDVGIGKIPYNGIPEIIEEKNRRKAGRTAPPQGLYLVEVYY
ncbi:MAG: tRNA pseudouridine(38-40) synthase TruA [Clostridia bacterium]|nr:tRNA pseudouridine(38-40) synthase TruA [Clostridia bacterium]